MILSIYWVLSCDVVFWPHTTYPVPEIFLIPLTGILFVYNDSRSESLNLLTNELTRLNVDLVTPAGANHLDAWFLVIYAGSTATEVGTWIVVSAVK